jgi:hypothetical protein
LQRDPGYRFKMNATATDLGTPPRSTNIELEILVVESHKKAPSFTFVPEMPIRLKENYNDYQKSVATLTAESNIPEEELVFMIVGGRTEQTNQRNTFILESEGSIAHIKLGRQLDYEAITEYTITVRVQVIVYVRVHVCVCVLEQEKFYFEMSDTLWNVNNFLAKKSFILFIFYSYKFMSIPKLDTLQNQRRFLTNHNPAIVIICEHWLIADDIKYFHIPQFSIHFYCLSVCT